MNSRMRTSTCASLSRNGRTSLGVLGTITGDDRVLEDWGELRGSTHQSGDSAEKSTFGKLSCSSADGHWLEAGSHNRQAASQRSTALTLWLPSDIARGVEHLTTHVVDWASQWSIKATRIRARAVRLPTEGDGNDTRRTDNWHVHADEATERRLDRARQWTRDNLRSTSRVSDVPTARHLQYTLTTCTFSSSRLTRTSAFSSSAYLRAHMQVQSRKG